MWLGLKPGNSINELIVQVSGHTAGHIVYSNNAKKDNYTGLCKA